MAGESKWKRTEENGFSSDPKEVETLLRVALAKLAAGEATGVFVLLCDADGFVYMADELPRSRSCVAESILALEAKADMLRESWKENSISFCERPPIMGTVEDDADPTS